MHAVATVFVHKMASASVMTIGVWVCLTTVVTALIVSAHMKLHGLIHQMLMANAINIRNVLAEVFATVQAEIVTASQVTKAKDANVLSAPTPALDTANASTSKTCHTRIPHMITMTTNMELAL